MSEAPESEVVPRDKRRIHSVAYKLKILEEAQKHREHGQLGPFLRKEGLYSGTLTRWREQQEKGLLTPDVPVKRGPAPDPDLSVRKELERTPRELTRTKRALAQAEMIIDIPKKVCLLLGLPEGPELESTR